MINVEKETKKQPFKFIGTGQVYDPKTDKYIDTKVTFTASELDFTRNDFNEAVLQAKLILDTEKETYYQIETKSL
ncbi:hypothetical protein [Bacillus infantis]|uniref:hypothetical protein n=1 Tax=Bacillus infantis TaxID=324767 RepID=UPI0020A0EE02|nr:hypothetical protein [Bacillus infantis]MCP1159305.1 hypothetical protein [Bacillus infantis]